MSTESTSENTDGGDSTAPAAPPAAERPTVDGTSKTSEELRAELEQLLAEDQPVADERDSAAGSVGPPATGAGATHSETAGADAVARIRAGRDTAVARVQHQVDRARTAVPEKASTVVHTVQGKAAELRTTVPDRASSLRTRVRATAASARDAAQDKPGLLGAVAAGLVLVLLARRLLKGR